MSELAVKPTKPIKSKLYEFSETANGVWKTFRYSSGECYREYRSNAELFGLPLVSIVSGRNPETDQMGHAHGIIAIGQRATGGLAIGQFVTGHIAIGQFSAGSMFAIGQFSIAPLSIGQFSLGLLTVGQIGAAAYGVFQAGAVLFDGIGQRLFSLFG